MALLVDSRRRLPGGWLNKRESKVSKKALLVTGSAQVYSQELATSVAENLQALEKG